jgi:hypothetical protein
MLPVGNLNNLYYPMTADIYYSRSHQNDFGEFEKTWQKDRTVFCSAIKERPDSKIRPALETEKFLQYDFRINMRTNEDIQRGSDDNFYPITDVLIRNIKDPAGNLVWEEYYNENSSFEIQAAEPMFNDLHVLAGYRILLVRSDRQVKIYV